MEQSCWVGSCIRFLSDVTAPHRRVVDEPLASARARTGDRTTGLIWALWVWGPAVALMVAIFGLSSISDLPPPPGRLSDKAAHALVYAVLGGLVLRAVAGARWAGVTLVTALAAALISALYGVSDELHQRFVPGRSAEALDAAVDALSATGGALVIWTWSIIRAAWAEHRGQSPHSP